MQSLSFEKALLALVALVACATLLRPAPSPVWAQFPDGGGGMSNLEAQLSQSINTERANAGLRRLFPNEAVMHAAQYHAANMASENKLTHDELGDIDNLNGDNDKNPDGTPKINGADRLLHFGYTFRRWRENTASGHRTSAACVAGWMESQGHKDNILADDVVHIGVGVATAANGRRYYCALFAKPR